jgi:hypothetical protein
VDFKDASVHPIAYFFTKRARSYEVLKNPWVSQKRIADKKDKMLNDLVKVDRGKKRTGTKIEDISNGLIIRKRSSLFPSITLPIVIFWNF